MTQMQTKIKSRAMIHRFLVTNVISNVIAAVPEPSSSFQ